MLQSDDPSQKNTMLVLKFLPFMIGYFSLSVPSGLSIYWYVYMLFVLLRSAVRYVSSYSTRCLTENCVIAFMSAELLKTTKSTIIIVYS
jgi:hypothetical protein